MRRTLGLALLGLLSWQALAYEITFDDSLKPYTDGIPNGWVLDGPGGVTMLVGNPSKPTGESESGLGFNFYGTDKIGSNIVHTATAVIPGADIECDNVFAHARVYFSTAKNDLLQIVVSTNDWASYITVGEPIMPDAKAWTMVERSRRIPGLSAHDVAVGILAVGVSKTCLAYIQTLKLQFVAEATPQDVAFEVGGEKISVLNPGETAAVVAATVDEYPTTGTGKVTMQEVYAVLDRNGVTTTNAMTRVGSSLRWRTEPIAPVIEAGEIFKVKVFSKYLSDIDTKGEKTEGVATEESDWLVQTGVKSGSAWINEFATDRVELAGTTNRVYLSGWALELADGAGATYRADLAGTFDFSTNMINGLVGLEVRELVWTDGAGAVVSDLAPGAYTLRLCNSAGIVEQTQTVTLPLSGSVGKVGTATWPSSGYACDWSGMATSNAFVWVALADASFGSVNAGQGFKVPLSATVTVHTWSPSGSGLAPLSYATVTATGYGLGNDADAGKVSTFSAQSQDGVATLEITGYCATPAEVAVTLSSTAFGWYCPSTNVVARDASVTDASLTLSATVASDDFSGTALNSYWQNAAGNTKPWSISSPKLGYKIANALYLDVYSSAGKSVLNCSNFLSARGRKFADVSFDIVNSVTSSKTIASFCVQMSTNANWQGTVIATPVLSNKRGAAYGNKEFYSYRAVVELPSAFANADEIWLRLSCEYGKTTGSYFYLDNLRIAFEDVAMPTQLARSVAAPTSGGDIEFSLDVEPRTLDEIAEVSADLMLDINGDECAVPFAFANGAATNSMSASEGAVRLTAGTNAIVKALGYPFLSGDVVKYYAAVHYDSANGETDPDDRYETRYFSDNAVTSTVNGMNYWVVEKGYQSAFVDSFSVSGDPLCVAGAPEPTTEGVKCLIHGYRDVGITNITVDVYADGVLVRSYPFLSSPGNPQVRVTDLFEADDLQPGTEYSVKITAWDANGEPLTASPVAFDFMTKPVIAEAVIRGISTEAVELRILNSGAAGYKGLEDWEAAGNKRWIKSGGTPNQEFAAEITATNKVGNGTATNVVGYTLAAVATRAPVLAKGMTNVTVSAAADYAAAADGNPELTEYAVLVTNDLGEAAIAATNGVAVWRPLAAWHTPLALSVPAIRLDATNSFSFITRNFAGQVSTNSTPVTTNCWFDLTAAITSAAQTAKPFGQVGFELLAFDPFQRQGVTAKLEYRLDDGAWQPLADAVPVAFTNMIVTTNLAWDAWSAVGKRQGTYAYRLRAQLGDGQRVSDWSAVASGTLDFEPPVLAVDGVPTAGTVTESRNYQYDLSATDAQPVTYGWLVDMVSGTTAHVEGAVAADGVHSFRAWATDAFGNVSPTNVLNWIVDTAAPTDLTLSGSPVSVGSTVVTNGEGFAFVASANDLTAISYQWMTNGVEVAGTVASNFTGKVGEGTNWVAVSATDAVGHACPAITNVWVVDVTAPTEPQIVAGLPAALTGEQRFSMTAKSEDATAVTYHWSLNGATEETANPFAGDAAEGPNLVTFYATDEAGNVSTTNSYRWKLDTLPPSNFVFVACNPASNAVVKTRAVDTSVTAEDASAITFRWRLNGGDWETVSGPESNRYVVAESEGLARGIVEGTNTLQVYATDPLHYCSRTNEISWVVDTIAPANLKVTGVPPPVTKATGFAMTATAEDATAITYHWSLSGAASAEAEGASFSRTDLAEGKYTVTVFARDAAGNDSAKSNYTWTVHTTPPAELSISGAPDAGTVTADAHFNFTANATDDCGPIVYHWTNVTAAVGTTASSYNGTGLEGTNTVSVTAEDSVGNVCAPVSRTWVVDTLAPTNLTVTGVPAPINKAKDLHLTASALDATVITYSWSLPGAEPASAVGASFDAQLPADGTYVLTVAATDEAQNATVTNFTWILDTTPPTVPAITGTPAADALTNDTTVALKAESTDATTIAYHWSLDGAAETVSTNLSAVVADGRHVASVYAVDAAGNSSGASEISWTVDTQPPYDLTLAGKQPFVGELPKNLVTTNGAVDLTVWATDEVSTVTYVWTFNGRPATPADPTNLVAAAVEGSNTVSVYARDVAGNRCPAITNSWVVDREAPRNLALSGTPAAGALTNLTTFAFTATATDATKLSYHWTLNGSDANTTAAEFGGASVEGANIVTVYAEDAAGNVCPAVTNAWTVDTVAPVIRLESAMPDPFNADTLVVTAKVSEALVEFPAAAVTVSNGSVAGIVTVDAGSATRAATYAISVTPAADGAVTVRVKAGAVKDLAGNGNEASNVLSRRSDRTKPTVVKFECRRIAPYFSRVEWSNPSDGQNLFRIKVEFSEPVRDCPAAAVAAVNASVASVAKIDDVTYAVALVPAADGEVTAQIKADGVRDLAGNGNVASSPMSRVYDTVAPTAPEFTGVPATGSTAAKVSLTASSTDANGIRYYVWSVNGTEAVLTLADASQSATYEVAAQTGLNVVRVYAVDPALNISEDGECRWTAGTIVAAVSPQNGAIAGDGGGLSGSGGSGGAGATPTALEISGLRLTGDTLNGLTYTGTKSGYMVVEGCENLSSGWTEIKRVPVTAGTGDVSLDVGKTAGCRFLRLRLLTVEE